MAMECDSPPPVPPEGIGQQQRSTVQEQSTAQPSSNFDLETYINRYAPLSETRLQRLLLIARHSTDDETARMAYEMAGRQMKENGDGRRYKEVFGPSAASSSGGGAGGAGSGSGSGESCAETSHPPPPEDSSSTARHPSDYSIPYDHHYAPTSESTARSRLEMLEARLSAAQTHLAKEAIRTAYLALGDFYRSRGELREALRRVLRSRDYCTSNRQSGQVCLMVIELGIDSRNYNQVRDYVTKAEHTTDLLMTDPLFPSKLRIASGLSFLSESYYIDAARKFASVSADFTNQYNTVASAEDVALYGALLGLATLDRNELRRTVLEGSNFKGRLELIPPVRDALRHYARAEYGSCLTLLNSVRPELDLDLHLRPHVTKLFEMIRDRCVVQYSAPYARVDVGTMGRCFGMDVEKMEDVLTSLIKEGKIKGRVNSQTRTLVSSGGRGTSARRRSESRRKVGRMAEKFLRETESMILRLSCLENDLIVQMEGRSAGGGGRYRPGRGRFGGMAGLGGGLHDVYGDGSSDEEDDEDVAMMDMDLVGGGDAAALVNPEDV